MTVEKAGMTTMEEAGMTVEKAGMTTMEEEGMTVEKAGMTKGLVSNRRAGFTPPSLGFVKRRKKEKKEGRRLNPTKAAPKMRPMSISSRIALSSILTEGDALIETICN
jgi:hypothetical protein